MLKKYDYNLIVIGAGAAGLVSSYIAATLKAKVALIEKHKMGGDCLNTGCVPSKALIKVAKVIYQSRRADKYGLKPTSIDFSFPEIMAHIHQVIAKIEPHDSVERYTNLGVECIQGEAEILSPHEVRVNNKVLSCRSLIIATGARPSIPSLPGMELITPLTSDNLWQISSLPKRLLILGGGPIGCELAQSFARLGSQVSIVEMNARLLPKEDADVASLIDQQFRSEKIKIHTNHKALRIEAKSQEQEQNRTPGQDRFLICQDNHGQDVRLPFDELLCAVGRKANTEGFGLDKLGIEISKQGTIKYNPFMATNYKNIFVCGDVAGPYQFTHMAAHQAYYASVNALFRPFAQWLPIKSLQVNYGVVPWCTFTDPEVATVGLTETAAKQAHIPYELTTYGIDDLDRAIADEEDRGLVKVLTPPGSDKILGATIVGAQAGELITEFIHAMKQGFGLNTILGTVHIYPTMSEANKYVAGSWKKTRKPEKALNYLAKVHTWLRGGAS